MFQMWIKFESNLAVLLLAVLLLAVLLLAVLLLGGMDLSVLGVGVKWTFE